MIEPNLRRSMTKEIIPMAEVVLHDHSYAFKAKMKFNSTNITQGFKLTLGTTEFANLDTFKDGTNYSINKEVNSKVESCLKYSQVDKDLRLLIQRTTEKLNKTSRKNYNMKCSMKKVTNTNESTRKSQKTSKKPKEKGSSILDIIGTIDLMLDTTKKVSDFECDEIDDLHSENLKKGNEFTKIDILPVNSGVPIPVNNKTKKTELNNSLHRSKSVFNTHIKIVGSNIIYSKTDLEKTKLRVEPVEPVKISEMLKFPYFPVALKGLAKTDNGEESVKSSETDKSNNLSVEHNELEKTDLKKTDNREESAKSSEIDECNNHSVEHNELEKLTDLEKTSIMDASVKIPDIGKCNDFSVKFKELDEKDLENTDNGIESVKIHEDIDILDLYMRTQDKLADIKRKNYDMRRKTIASCFNTDKILSDKNEKNQMNNQLTSLNDVTDSLKDVEMQVPLHIGYKDNIETLPRDQINIALPIEVSKDNVLTNKACEDLYKRTQDKLADIKRKNDMRRKIIASCFNTDKILPDKNEKNQMDNQLTSLNDVTYSLKNVEMQVPLRIGDKDNIETSPQEQINIALPIEVSKDDALTNKACKENSVELNEISVDKEEISLYDLDGLETASEKETCYLNLNNNIEILRLYNKTQYKLKKLKRKNYLMSKKCAESTENNHEKDLCSIERRSKRYSMRTSSINGSCCNTSDIKSDKCLLESVTDNEVSGDVEFRYFDKLSGDVIEDIQRGQISPERLENDPIELVETKSLNKSETTSPKLNNSRKKAGEDILSVSPEKVECEFSFSENNSIPVVESSVDDIDFSLKSVEKKKIKHMDEEINIEKKQRKLYYMRKKSDQNECFETANSCNNDVKWNLNSENQEESGKTEHEKVYDIRRDTKEGKISVIRLDLKNSMCIKSKVSKQLELHTYKESHGDNGLSNISINSSNSSEQFQLETQTPRNYISPNLSIQFQEKTLYCTKDNLTNRKSTRISKIREKIIDKSIIPIQRDLCIKVDDVLLKCYPKKKSNYFDGKVYNTRKLYKANCNPDIESVAASNCTDECDFQSILSELDPKNLTSNLQCANNDIDELDNELDFLGITGMNRIKAIRWDYSNFGIGKKLPEGSGMIVKNITIENICKFNNIQYSKSVVYQTQFSKLFFDEVNMLLSIYPVMKKDLNNVGKKVKRKRKFDRKTEQIKVAKLNPSNQSDQEDPPLSDSSDVNHTELENSTQVIAEEHSKDFSEINKNNDEDMHNKSNDSSKVSPDDETLKPSVVRPFIFDNSFYMDNLPYRKKFASEYGQSPSEILDTLRGMHYDSEDCYFEQDDDSTDFPSNFFKIKSYPLRNRNLIYIP